MGCDLQEKHSSGSYGDFNPRTRMGCDWSTADQKPPAYPFQSTHPHGVRLARIKAYSTASRFQSTHPHGVRHHDLSDSVVLLDISIHAPAWGATMIRANCAIIRSFQSTHPHGVRQLSQQNSSWKCIYFNPRTRMGCDVQMDWDALSPEDFNPRTRMGCDG